MKKKIIYLLFPLLCCVFKGNTQQLNNLLFSNVDADNQVLELDISASYTGTPFYVGIVRNGQVYAATFIAREGMHVYDLRQINEWTGLIEHVATSIPKTALNSNRLIRPGLLENWDLFMDVEGFSPKTVNFVQSKSIFGVNFTYLLCVFAVIFSLLGFFLFKKTLLSAILTGIVVAFILMDVRYMVDRWRIVDTVEQNYPYVQPLTIPQKFINKVKPIIGSNMWAFQGAFTDDYFKLFFQYSLADIPYHLNWRNDVNNAPTGTYIITEKPFSDQKILVQEGNFYLVLQP